MTYFRRPSKTKGESGDSHYRRKELPQSYGANVGKQASPSVQDPKDLPMVGPYVDQAQDIISDIHQLLHAAPLDIESLGMEPLDIVDLKRPVGKAGYDASLAHQSPQPTSAKHRHAAHPESSADSFVMKDHSSGQRPPIHDLHADVVAQTSQAMNEFTQVVQASAKRGKDGGSDAPQSIDPHSIRAPSLEAMVQQAVNQAVSQWMTHNAAALQEASQSLMRQHVPALVAQWLNKHLPDQLRQSIDHHLHAIAQTARQPHERAPL